MSPSKKAMLHAPLTPAQLAYIAKMEMHRTARRRWALMKRVMALTVAVLALAYVFFRGT